MYADKFLKHNKLFLAEQHFRPTDHGFIRDTIFTKIGKNEP